MPPGLLHGNAVMHIYIPRMPHFLRHFWEEDEKESHSKKQEKEILEVCHLYEDKSIQDEHMVKDEGIENSTMLDVCLAEPRIGNSQLWILGLTLSQFGKFSEPLLNADTE